MMRNLTVKLDGLSKDSYQVTPEGFLTCSAAVTRAGVFDYVDDNGRKVRELRSREEVFDKASLATLAMIPVTFLHPEERRVTVDNNRRLNVGMTGENVTHDDELVHVPVKLTDKAVVSYVIDQHRQKKDVELSCGYDAQILPISGEHATEGHYDAVQKNIRYNHLSIVLKGRAGSKVKLKLDAKQEEQTMFKFTRGAMKIDGFHMDAIDADVPQEAQGLLSRLSSKLDEAIEVIKDRAAKIVELTKKVDEAQAKADTLTEEMEKLKTDNADLSNPAGEKIQKIIADRKAIEETAAKVDVKADGLSDRDLKVAVIQKQSPDFTVGDRSDDYINARYDSVVEMLDTATENNGAAGIAKVIRDASQTSAQGKVDHRSEFIKKSNELAEK